VFTAADMPVRPFYHRQSPALDLAEKFLAEFLAKGPRPSTEVIAVGEQLGMGRTTLYRARNRMGLVCDVGDWSV